MKIRNYLSLGLVSLMSAAVLPSFGQQAPSNASAIQSIQKFILPPVKGLSYFNPQNKPNTQHTKAKTTNTSFNRIKASSKKYGYDDVTMTYNYIDSNIYSWHGDNGDNVNLLDSYNNIFSLKGGNLYFNIDFSNLEYALLQNIYYLGVDIFPAMDSAVYYYNGSPTNNAYATVNGSEVDSATYPYKHYKYQYDANGQITKRIGYFGSGQIASLDTIVYSATNKKLSHYALDNDGSPTITRINEFAYDVNDNMIMASYVDIRYNQIYYGGIDSTFNITPTKDSVVCYTHDGTGYIKTAIKVNYKTNGILDSTHHFEYDNMILGKNILYYTRNANNNITELEFQPYQSDSFVLYKSYTQNEQIASSHIGIRYMGNLFYMYRDEYEYNAEDNILKFASFSDFDYNNNVWDYTSSTGVGDFYYELFDPCSLSVAYNRLDPNDSLCTDIELTFTGETLPINILVTTPSNPTGVSHTITALPYVLTNLCPDQYTITAEDDNGCVDTLTFAIQDLTSIDGIALENQIQVYPNPAKDMVRIEGVKAGATLTLIDMFGRKLMQTTATAKTHQLDLSKVASGIYTVQIRLDDATANKKIILSK